MITHEQLRKLIAEFTPAPTVGDTHHAPLSFDLEQFLATYLTAKRGPEPYEGGGWDERWIVQCPFNPEHGGTSAAVFRHKSGKVGFRCQHDGCTERHWRDVRELFEPDYRNSNTSSQRRTAKSEPQTHLLLTRADAVPIKRVAWLAYERIPVGGVTLFDGPGGIGKTTFLTGLIAKATRGIDFFTGAPMDPQSCLIVGVEDSRALIVQRLKLYGADLSRIHFVDSARTGDRNNPLVFPDHVPIVEQAIMANRIGIVYVDALFSHIALSGEGRMPQQARAAMQPIGELCERLNVAFLAMRHWTKATGAAASRALGSIEFTNFARSVFTFGPHPNDDGLVVCSHTKSNYARLTGAVSFKIVAHDVLDDHGLPWQVTVASDLATAEGISSDDLAMKAPGDPDERTAAAEWLRDYLADGEPHLFGELCKAASRARAGSRSTLWRAARSLDVIKERTDAFPSVGTWRLKTARDDHAGQAQIERSRFMSQVDETSGSGGERGDHEQLAVQGFGSRSAVVSQVKDGSSKTTAETTRYQADHDWEYPRELDPQCVICRRHHPLGENDGRCIPPLF